MLKTPVVVLTRGERNKIISEETRSKCTRRIGSPEFESRSRATDHSSQFKNGGGSALSRGLYQSTSSTEARSRHRLSGAAASILAHLFSSSRLDTEKPRSKRQHEPIQPINICEKEEMIVRNTSSIANECRDSRPLWVVILLTTLFLASNLEADQQSWLVIAVL
jgi:hypothetical protein